VSLKQVRCPQFWVSSDQIPFPPIWAYLGFNVTLSPYFILPATLTNFAN
jgi:hypothetical protein